MLVVDSRFKAKHSLDSDEEDEVKESSLMDEEEIEGQEDSTVVGGPVGCLCGACVCRWEWGEYISINQSINILLRCVCTREGDSPDCSFLHSCW